jgi:hypothetical protein
MANVIEEAKSGRAACRTCKQPIAKGALRLGVETPNSFGDAPSLQWHHLTCAAGKLPVELKAALAEYPGEVPDRAALDAAMADAIQKGNAKPGGFPYVDRAPTGRARCLQCREAIDKGVLRVAIERDIETGGMAQKSAGYLHPACAATHAAEKELDLEVLVEGLKSNSRVPELELAEVVATIQA